MKKLIMLALVLASFTTLRAQSLTVNNNAWGDVYVTVYAMVPASCSTLVDYAQIMVPAYNSQTLNLNLAASWNLGSVPTSPYELVYATVSRDPLCPGTLGWGFVNGTCWMGGNEQFDEITIGDPVCGYNNTACLEVTLSGGPACGGFNDGDYTWATFTPGGVNAFINVN